MSDEVSLTEAIEGLEVLKEALLERIEVKKVMARLLGKEEIWEIHRDEMEIKFAGAVIQKSSPMMGFWITSIQTEYGLVGVSIDKNHQTVELRNRTSRRIIVSSITNAALWNWYPVEPGTDIERAIPGMVFRFDD